MTNQTERTTKLVSIVVPCYNEEKNINRTIDGIQQIFENHSYDVEIIAINDGSKDNTWNVIKEYSKKYKNVVGVNQMTNYGLSQAYQAGFDISKGDYIITCAADLETPFENLIKIVEYLDEGYDFVNTNRNNRWGGDNSGRAAKSGAANKILSRISGVQMKDRGSGMKGFRRILAENLKFYGEMHRFIPDYLTAFGAKMIEFDVEFKDRDFGVSAYANNRRAIKVMLDLLTLSFMLYFSKKPFSMMPGRLFGATGAALTGLGGLVGVYLLILKLFGQSIGDRPLLIASVVLVIVGVQSMMMGMLGELLLRIYFEGSNKRSYLVRETVGN